MKIYLSRSAVVFVFFLTGLLVLYGALLWGNKALYFRDIYHNYEPHLSYMRQVIWQGQIPLWHSAINTGTPLAPGLEPPLFYPGTWLFFMPLLFSQALGLNLLLHHILAGIGMFWLGRVLGWQPLSCIVAALGFSLGGVMISMNNLHPLMNTVAWLPLAFGLMHSLLTHPSCRLAISLGLVYGLQILSGHLEIVFFESLLLGAYALVFFLPALYQQDPVWRKILLWSSLALVTGLLLGAIQLLPSLSFIPITVREGGLALSEAQFWSWNPFLLLLFFLPDSLGNAYQQSSLHVIFGDSSFGFAALFFSVYGGMAALLLAVLGLFTWKHQPQKKLLLFCSLALLISLILALGQYTPLYRFLHEWLPGLSFFRYPSKTLIFSSFLIALLSGLGLEVLYKETLVGWRHLGLATALLVLVLGLIFGLIHSDVLQVLIAEYRADLTILQQSLLQQKLRNALNQQIGQALLLLLISVFCLGWWLRSRKHSSFILLATLLWIDLLSSGMNLVWLSERDTFTTPPKSLSHLKAIRSADHSAPHLHRLLVDAQGTGILPADFLPEIKDRGFLLLTLYQYQNLQTDLPIRWEEHSAIAGWQAITQQMHILFHLYKTAIPEEQASFRNMLETLMSVRYILVANPDPEKMLYMAQSGHYRLRQDLPELNSGIWENLNWQSRVRFVTQAMVMPDQDMALKAMLFSESGFKPREHVILEKTPTLEALVQQIPPHIPVQPNWSEPEILQESNQRLEIGFETNQSGYLVLADQWTPGWKAFLNGQEVPVLRANFFQRAIRVGAGQHQLRFEYHLPGLALGSIFSVLALLLMLVLFCWQPRKKNVESS